MRKTLCVILIISLLSHNIFIYAQNIEESSGENQAKNNTQKESKTLEQLQKEANELNTQIVENSEISMSMGISVISFSELFTSIVSVYLILGIGIGVIGSSISMKKYLEV